MPDGAAQLVVTSPPYNLGKSYEKVITLEDYLAAQEETIKEAFRVLSDKGSLCWQVGNHIAKNGEVYPLDTLIYPMCKRLGMGCGTASSGISSMGSIVAGGSRGGTRP